MIPGSSIQPSGDGYCLSLRNFGVAYGEHVVLSDVSLDVPATGIVTLVGPTGTGKSTLLRTIAGFNRHIPALRTWGTATYGGVPLADTDSPILVSQNTRLLTSTLLENLLYYTPQRFAATAEQKRERAVSNLHRVGLDLYEESLSRPIVELPLVAQRLVAIARAAAAEPALVLIDEPTFGLEETDANEVLRVMRDLGQYRAVLVVLHNQGQIRQLPGLTALLAGGVIQDIRPTEDFFASPSQGAAQEFVETGTCSEPSPGARPEDIATGVRPRIHPPPPEVMIPSETLGPRGFVWLIPGKLAGTPRPGVVNRIENDLAALRRVGITTLVSLTSTPLDSDLLEHYGISAHWFPIPDMGAPSPDLAKRICTTMDNLLSEGASLAVHCRAGQGRTGTVLVAYLIWRGASAMEALESARRFEPKWVQSEKQVQFLEEFETELRAAA